jgi:hypothetical protein
MEAPLQSCTLTRDLGVPRLARTHFGSSFGEPTAPFGMAHASQSVADTVQRLREKEELDLAPYELSLIHTLRPVAPLWPSAETTLRIERAIVGTAVAIFGLIAVGVVRAH